MSYPYKDLPSTRHTVFYSYAIMINTAMVGSFEKFSVSFTRAHERIREIYNGQGARTKEMLWSTTDINISVDHVELYTESMLQALGYDLVTIEDLNSTMDILEYMYIPKSDDPNTPGPTAYKYDNPANTPNNQLDTQRIITYHNCVATSVNKEINTGTAKVVESMTFECRTVSGASLQPHAPSAGTG